MTEVISAIEEATGLTCYPLVAKHSGECIVYEYAPQTDDGVKEQVRLKVRVISSDIPNGYLHCNQIKKLLLTIGDDPNDYGMNSCWQNGGGMMVDNTTGMIHTLLYLYFVRKVERTDDVD